MPVIANARKRTKVDQADLERWREIPVAIAVDLAGDIRQIDPAIRPLKAPGQQPRLFGRAVTALAEPPDFGSVLHAIDLCGPGDVLVIAAGGHCGTAMIGEILCGHLRRLGCSGVICDGAVRDAATLAGWTDFPVFARSINPRGPSGAERGTVEAQVVFGGALIAPGDLILGDDDGLAVIPPQAIRSRIADALAKGAREIEWIASLNGGRTVRETFGLPAPKTSKTSQD